MAGGLSPYANLAIKNATTNENGEVNTSANVMAHAILGAIEARISNSNVAAGAVAGGGGELMANVIAKTLYGMDGTTKTANDLTEAQKNTITVLSQLAGGLAGGLLGDSTQSAVLSSEISKRAVENNGLSEILSGQVDANALLAQAKGEEAKNVVIREITPEVMKQLRKEHVIGMTVVNGMYQLLLESGNVLMFTHDKLVETAPLILTGGTTFGAGIAAKIAEYAVSHPKTTETIIAGTYSTYNDMDKGDISFEKDGIADSILKIGANYGASAIKSRLSTKEQLAFETAYTGFINANEKGVTPEEVGLKVLSKDAGIVLGNAVSLPLKKYKLNDFTRIATTEYIGNLISDKAEEKLSPILNNNEGE